MLTIKTRFSSYDMTYTGSMMYLKKYSVLLNTQKPIKKKHAKTKHFVNVRRQNVKQ